MKVYIIERETMEILTSFGDGGRQPGQFFAVHSIATDSDGNRKTFTGTPQQIADDVKAYEELGVSDLMLGLQAPTLEETVTRLERFTETVKPLVA